MSYASRQDLAQRYGEAELVARAGRPGGDAAAVEAAIAAALADADALVDAYAAPRYRTPLDPVPAIVRNAAAAIAWHRLHTLDMPEPVRQAYEDAERLLRRIASGEVRLAVPAAGEAAAAAPNLVVIEAPPRLFDRESLSGL